MSLHFLDRWVESFRRNETFSRTTVQDSYEAEYITRDYRWADRDRFHCRYRCAVDH